MESLSLAAPLISGRAFRRAVEFVRAKAGSAALSGIGVAVTLKTTGTSKTLKTTTA